MRLELGLAYSAWLATLASGVSVPDCFSLTGQGYEVPHCSLENVLVLLGRFEVDTHIEVVLIGEEFDASTGQELSQRLESLSRQSSSAQTSPLAFVHEKLIFHTTLGNLLLAPVRDIIHVGGRGGGEGGRSTVDPSKVAKVLGEYHSRAATTTTLFVHRLNDGGGSSSKNSSYSYSSLLPYCTQMAFIARDSSFAWIDLSASAQSIQPAGKGRHILPPLSSELKADEFASLLYSSAEALSPFPSPGFQPADFSSEGTSSTEPSATLYKQQRDGSQVGQYLTSPPRRVHISILTICLDDSPGISCEEDLKTLVVAEQLSRLYSSSYLGITTEIALVKASEEPQIAHAVHASVSYFNPAVPQHSQAITISSRELIYWLSSSALVKKMLLHNPHMTPDTLLLPVFVLRTSPSLEIFFDESYQQTVALFLPPPSVAEGGNWPKRSIAAIRYSGSAKSPIGSLAKVHPALHCAGVGLPPGDGYADDQMRHAMRESIWGISPPRFHYSASSRNIVQDFLWATPPALRRLGSNINGAESFREKRAVHRHTFIHRAENILRRFADAIRLAASIVPTVNTSRLLDLPEFPPPVPLPLHVGDGGGGGGGGGGKRGQGRAARQPTATPRRGKVAPAKTIRRGLLEEFLFYMEDAAAEFSHLEYEAALLHLDSAEIKAQILESRISDVIAQRTGSITCAQPNSTQNEDLYPTSPSSPNPQRSLYFYRSLLVFAGLVTGCVAFFFLEETAKQPKTRKKSRDPT